MSAAEWFVVGLALVLANLPFANQRLFGVVARGNTKPGFLRLIELLVLYFVVGIAGRLLESHAGNVFAQGWQFYAVTICVFLVCAFPGFTWRYLVHHR